MIMNKENIFKYMSAEQIMSTWNDAARAYYGSIGVKLPFYEPTIKSVNTPNERPVENKRKTFEYEDLKPGMVLVTDLKHVLVLFPMKGGIGYVNYNSPCTWDILMDCFADNFGIDPEHHTIDLVYDVLDGNTMPSGYGDKINTIIWKRQIAKPKIEITKEMIAEKFDVDVEQIELV